MIDDQQEETNESRQPSLVAKTIPEPTVVKEEPKPVRKEPLRRAKAKEQLTK